MSSKLPYGLKDGKLLHISEVPDNENGLACGCKCPSPYCNDNLIAKTKGKKRDLHFAHANEDDCKYGLETGLHIAAKEILAKEKKFFTPKVLKCFFAKDILDEQSFKEYEHRGYGTFDFLEIIGESKIKVDDVYLEKRVEGFIPDIIIVSGKKKLLVEIAVTHFVDNIKLEKIRKAGFPLIEINLSHLKNDFTTEILKSILIEGGSDYKTWIHNSKLEKLFDEAKLKIETEVKNRHELYKSDSETTRLYWENERKKRIQEKEKELLENPQQFYKPIVEIVRRFQSGVRTPNEGILEINDCYEKYINRPALSNEDYQNDNHTRNQKANLKEDCLKCKQFKGLREDGKKIECMGEFERLMSYERM